MSQGIRIVIIATSVAAAAALMLLYSRYATLYPSTDDAFVDADTVGVVARVAGPTTNIPVAAHQHVDAGDLLFDIDPRPFQLAVDVARAQVDETGEDVSALADEVSSAEAQLAGAEAQLRLARAQYARIQPLIEVGAVPYQDKDKADAGLAEAKSNVLNAKAGLAKAKHELGKADSENPEMRVALANLENAELQLSWTKVTSPVNGYVTDPIPSLGDYASPGETVITMINTDTWRIIAYLRETQLERIRPGQPARVDLLAYPGVSMPGTVQGIAWGVDKATGETSADGLPSVSPTVDWVRMAQRFPVRILLNDLDPAHPLRSGMRATVRIDTTGELADPNRNDRGP
jgi:membrane fusion protein (multidrug efflux system)